MDGWDGRTWTDWTDVDGRDGTDADGRDGPDGTCGDHIHAWNTSRKHMHRARTYIEAKQKIDLDR